MMLLMLTLLIEVFVPAIVQRVLRQPAASDQPQDDAAGPLADFDRVQEDLERAEALLASGRVREGHEAVRRLVDVMNGVDEAAATDARWAEFERAA